MHEWALAEAILASASQTAAKEGLREVTEIKIGIGELQQIEPDILEFALSQLRGSRFGKTVFVIKKVEAKLRCKVCGQNWFFSKDKLDKETAEAIHFLPEVAHTYIRCPKCKSPDFEIIKGRGIWLKTVKGVR